MRELSENLQCKNPSFFINWLDPLDLSKRKKLSDLCYIFPRGTREGMPYFFFEKSVFVKHTTPHPSPITNPVTRTRTSSRVTYTRSPGPGPGPPQGSPVIVMQVRRLKVAGMGLEKPKLLCYVFILSLSDGESPYIHTPPCSTCNTELS